MKVSIYRKNSLGDDEKDLLLDENNIPKNKYNNIILILRVLVACVFAFNFGYLLFPFVDDFLKDFIIVGLKFLFILIFMYLILGYIFTFISTMFLPKAFKADNIKVYISIFSAKVRSKEVIKEARIIFALLVPVILLSLVPIIFFIINGFNIYLYAAISASTIKSVSYLFYVIVYIAKYSEVVNVEIYDYIN
ncbi:hypothetical protein [Clostridium isatidis]|uniref:Uncharacterized protein n=1 Tax=Clostridium isatidis TaxID=182773 RepID=A0A343JBB1_9CLOT|nr:hypothetical protein [Clostridium isatidis]ASW42819.1 hypothetical protein BEN51_04835 [Clostridium isatidis]NLZ35823.1 hypothetical protein [Clostridiales bacterium]